MKPSTDIEFWLKCLSSQAFLRLDELLISLRPGDYEKRQKERLRGIMNGVGLGRPNMPLEQIEYLLENVLEISERHSSIGVLGLALSTLSRRYLKLNGHCPFVKHDMMLELMDAGLLVVPDQLACWRVAEHIANMRDGRSEGAFIDWPPYLRTDAQYLKFPLRAEMVECHVHLGGVPSTLDLWSELVTQSRALRSIKKLREWKRRLDEGQLNALIYQRLKDIHIMRHMLGVVIALFQGFRSSCIYSILEKYQRAIMVKSHFEVLSAAGETDDLAISAGMFIADNLHRQYSFGVNFSPAFLSPEAGAGNFYLQERQFLIKAFITLRRHGKELPHWYRPVLFAYLAIQNIFHQAVTQHSKRLGFLNFLDWYDSPARKLSPNWSRSRQHYILQSVTNDRRQRVEGRVTPERETLSSWIEAYYHTLFSEDYRLGRDFGLVAHLIKMPPQTRPPKKTEEWQTVWTPVIRHRRLRREIKKIALNLEKYRAEDPDAAAAILAIDAARHERDASPEIFAPAFRYLRRSLPLAFRRFTDTVHRCDIEPLKATYHVGESFHHPISGLRAVYEALHFLDLRPGDRIGHGIVLGIDPEKWIKTAGTDPQMPREERLDNWVWIHHMLRFCSHCDEEIKRLENYIAREFNELYWNETVPPTTEGLNDLLAAAWKMRWMDPVEFFSILENLGWNAGTHPEGLVCGGSPMDVHKGYSLNRICPASMQGNFRSCVKTGHCLLSQGDSVNLELCDAGKSKNWFLCSAVRDLRTLPENMEWRATTVGLNDLFEGLVPLAAIKYLWRYQFNVEYYIEARKKVKWEEFEFDWVKCFHEIREKVLQEIADREVTIEVCPSSNYLIGGFGELTEHPVFSFNAHGLDEKNNRKTQVVVNTDNPGIFNTSLKREYALLAAAAEKKGYHKENVRKWIDYLRNNSIEKTFLHEGAFHKKEEIEPEFEVVKNIDFLPVTGLNRERLYINRKRREQKLLRRIDDLFGF